VAQQHLHLLDRILKVFSSNLNNKLRLKQALLLIWTTELQRRNPRLLSPVYQQKCLRCLRRRLDEQMKRHGWSYGDKSPQLIRRPPPLVKAVKKPITVSTPVLVVVIYRHMTTMTLHLLIYLLRRHLRHFCW